MPAIVISAVNTGTDTLTATAHGLLTGDRCRLRNVGGALPASTPALVGAVDVFAVRVDADNFKLADTNAHALASTGIVDLTGALGAGTTTVEYGLPFCTPNVIAAAGTQVKSVDLNGTWNALVATYDLLTGQAQSVWSTIVVALTVTFNALVTFAAGATAAVNQHFTVSGTGKYKHGTRTIILGPGAFQIEAGAAAAAYTPGALTLTSSNAPIAFADLAAVPSGKQINEVRWYIQDNATGADALTGTLVKNDGSGTITTIGTSNTSAFNGTDQVLTLTGLTTNIAAGNSFSVRVSAAATASVKIYKAEVDIIE